MGSSLFESLESRRLMATFNVDGSIGSFNAAVLGANANPGVDLIRFWDTQTNQPYNGTVVLGVSPPATITEGVVIQGNGAANTILNLGGQSGIGVAGAGVEFHDLTVTANGKSISAASGGAFYAGVTAHLSLFNVTIDGTNARQAGGAIYNQGNTELSNCTIRNTYADDASFSNYRGGAIYNAAGSTTVVSTTFFNTHATDEGGAIYNAAGASLVLQAVTIDHGSSTNSHGGGIANRGVLVLTDTLVTGCSAGPSAYGGGIYSDGLDARLTMTRGGLTGNTAFMGGGVLISQPTAATFSGTSFDANAAAVNGGGGGAYVAVGASAVFARCTFTNNSTPSSGGGILSFGTLAVQESSLSANRAGQGGGGLWIESGSATITGSRISNNNLTSAAHWGAGITVNSGSLTLRNSTIDHNTAPAGGYGGGVYLAPGTTALITNSTITLNTASGRGGGIDVNNNATTLISNIVSDNGPTDISGAVDPSSSRNLIKNASSAGGLTAGGANANLIGIDPMLAIAAAANGGLTFTFALSPASPAIDTGANPAGLTADQRGGSFSRTDGSAPDIGAFEYVHPAPHTYVVTIAADEDDGDRSAGDLSLREAIFLANANAGMADTVTFAPGVKLITLTLGQLPAIADPITITGPGQSALTISGNSASRILLVNDSLAGAIAVTIQDLTLTSGSVDNGGAISNAETLTINRVTFSSNAATTAGGAIFNDGTLLVTASTFTQNGSPRGGAIEADAGTATVRSCYFTLNEASQSGGGIDLTAGSLTVENSAFYSNGAGSGGGIFTSATLVVRQSTFVANLAKDFGGGIAMLDGTLSLTNSTVVANVAEADADGIGQGGGVEGGKLHASGVLTIISSIIARNLSGSPDGAQTPSDITLSGGATLSANSSNNLVGSGATAGGLSNAVNHNIVGLDPKIGVPAAGDTNVQFLVLKAGSPAIDAGLNPDNLTTDQRGYARVGGAAIDIGAYETRVFKLDATTAPTGAADPNGVHRVATVDSDGHIIVFEEGWNAVDLQERTGAQSATGQAIIWVDPKDSLTYVAAPSGIGLMLFARSSAGAWSLRYLASEIGAPSSPTKFLTQFASVGGTVVIAGLTLDGKIVAFQQTLGSTGTGAWAYKFVDISGDLSSQSMATPSLVSLTSYVPSWDSWHLSGLDTDGKVQSVWIAPATFTKWRADDLSAITGAPKASGQLAVTLTSWGGINLTSPDNSGHLLTTWWVPSFGGSWLVNDLTTQFGGTPLSGGQVSSFVTPWGGLNYVGFAADGTVTVYWWAPASPNSAWKVEPLLPSNTQASSVPTSSHGLSASSAANGTLSVYGISAGGDALRLSWNPSGANLWKAENLSTLATRQ